MIQARYKTKIALPFLLAMISGSGFADKGNYSPYASRDFPENVYWGDTHVHTSLSADAYGWGNRLDPEVAYRFATGETITSHTGQPLRISVPLDFIVVADHAEFLGVLPMLDAEDPALLDTELGKRWHALYADGKSDEVFNEFVAVNRGELDLEVVPSIKRSVWNQVIRSAERYNSPGKFTAFIGFEWSATPQGNNLHRILIFRDGPEQARQVIPLSAVDSSNPEKLWEWMGGYESETGGQILAIPHNGNLSNGLMFSEKTVSGETLTQEYAKTRSQWEPLYEITQIKGDAEAHPYLSPNDHFADFETWDFGNMNIPSEAKRPEMLKHEYARSALKLGLKLENQLGVNPFKFGVIGSTDSHAGFATVSENNFFGHFPSEEPSPDRLDYRYPSASMMPALTKLNSAGLAGVWAQENTRKSIFDAMQRKETYATTGPRITVRFFGGWGFEKDDSQRPDYVEIGYRKGVPMGGDLVDAPAGQAPTFLILASKDPQGANLDRIQVVKGWLDSQGDLQEKIYDVALSDGRTVARDGQVKPLRHTVNVETATYTNSIGETQLATVWKDPDFDSEERAFYYARVIEIPTPRWTTYDAAFFGLELADDVPAVIQERAYTSPIWYTP